MSSRRGHGEGSIYQRKRDGLWIAAVDCGFVEGRRKRKTLSAKTRKEAAEKLKVMLRDQQQGLPIAMPRQRVGQFLDHWLADVVKPSARPTTYRSYEGIVRVHLKPALGRHQLAALTPRHVQQMLKKLATGLSVRSGQVPA